MTIEKTPTHISTEYAHLFEIGDHLQNIQNLEVEDIILQVCSKDREIQLGRKFNHINSRIISQDMQAEISSEKARNLRQTNSLYLEGIAVAFHVASAFFGGQTNFTGGSFAALAQAATSAGSYQDKLMRAEEDGLNLSQQRQSSIERDYSQYIQSSDKERDQDTNAIERMIQNSRRQGELLIGG